MGFALIATPIARVWALAAWVLMPFAGASPAPGDVVAVKSKIIDGATGKAIPAFVEQGGRVDPKDPTQVIWGYSEGRVEQANPEGLFRTHIDWAGGQRIRILAPGYAPQALLAGPPPKGAETVEVIVRLTRGREVAGTIRDAKGDPVAKAAVFLVGKRQVNITGGQAVREHVGGADKTFTRSLSAHDGRFAMTGGDDDDRLVVSAPGLDFWVVPLPKDPNAPCDVRLPEPGRLTIEFDIAGAAAEGIFFLQMLTHEVPGWEEIRHVRLLRQPNGTNRTLANLAPGVYSITRTKSVQIGDSGFGAMLDRQRITIEPGGAAEAVFIRKTGAAITGRVEWPGREASDGAFVTVKPGKVTDDPLQPKFDATKTAPDGSFSTERLPPGDYTIAVQAYIPRPKDGPLYTGSRAPEYVGTAKVTVPAGGAPKPVTITLELPGKAGAK